MFFTLQIFIFINPITCNIIACLINFLILFGCRSQGNVFRKRASLHLSGLTLLGRLTCEHPRGVCYRAIDPQSVFLVFLDDEELFGLAVRLSLALKALGCDGSFLGLGEQTSSRDLANSIFSITIFSTIDLLPSPVDINVLGLLTALNAVE